MSDQSNIEQPKIDMQEIVDSIPKRKDSGERETEEDVKRMIDYLKNPYVIEMRKIYEDSATRPGYKLRLALGYIQGGGIRFKGIDIDTQGSYTLDELLSGKKAGYRSDIGEILTYIGRLSDIENSNEPPLRSNIFKRDIEMIFGKSEEL